MILSAALACLLASPPDLASPPLALVASGDSIEIFATGPDSAIWTRTLRPLPYPGRWTPWVSLGGKASTPPAVAASKDQQGQVRLDLFHFGPDSALQNLVRTSTRWSTPTRLAGLRSGLAPSAAWRKGELDVFATSPDRLVRRATWNGTMWVTPVPTLPDSTRAAPVALGFDPANFFENLYIQGRDGAFREQWWNGSTWNGPVTVPGSGFASAAATVYYADRSHLLCATDSVSTLSCDNYVGSTWGGWMPVASGISSAPSLVQTANGSFHLLALDAHRQVVRFYRPNIGSAWSVIDTTLLPLDSSRSSSPRTYQHRDPPFALHATADTGLAMFRADPTDSTLQSRTWHRGVWSPWIPLGGKAASAPTVSSDGAALAWRRADSSLGFRVFSAGSWGDESTVPDLKTDHSPSLAFRGTGLDLVATTSKGLFAATWSSGAWISTASLGSSVPHAPLALGFDANNQYQNVYVVDSLGVLKERWWDGSGWSSWSNLSAFPQPAVTAPASVHLGGGRHIACIGLPSNTLSCLIWNGSAWTSRSDFPNVASAGALTLTSDKAAHLLALDASGSLVHFRYGTKWERVLDDGSLAPLAAGHAARPREINALLVRDGVLDLSGLAPHSTLRLVSTNGRSRSLPWALEQRLPTGAWSHLVIGDGAQARTLKLIRLR